MNINSWRMALVLALLGKALAGPGAAPVRAADGPTLTKASVLIRLEQSGYWAPGAKDFDYTTTAWFPMMKFQVRGPVPGGSQFAVEFTRPDGKLWARVNCDTREIGADEWDSIFTPRPSRPEGEKKYTKATGVYGFKIRLKNALAGKDEVLYAGKFKVGKVDASLGIPKFKNKFNFYADHDWALPIGYVGLFQLNTTSSLPPKLDAWTWIKGKSGNYGQLTGYLFYKGKQVSSTKDPGGSAEIDRYGADMDMQVLTANGDKGDPTWHQLRFEWPVVATNPKPEEELPAGYWALDKNPGEYEAKVLRDGKLCRSVKFTVGEGGKVVDNGIGAANKLDADRTVVPVKVLGTQDGVWDKTAWKTYAFYGNPLQGFTAP